MYTGIQENRFQGEEWRCVGNWDDSALSTHCKNCQVGVDWENYHTISSQHYYYYYYQALMGV